MILDVTPRLQRRYKQKHEMDSGVNCCVFIGVGAGEVGVDGGRGGGGGCRNQSHLLIHLFRSELKGERNQERKKGHEAIRKTIKMKQINWKSISRNRMAPISGLVHAGRS